MIAVELALSILGVLLGVLGWLLVGLLGLALLLVLVPVHARAAGRARLEGDEGDRLEGTFRVAWGAGLVVFTGSLGEGLWLRVLGLRVARLRPGHGPGRGAKVAHPEERPGRQAERRGRGGAWFWRHRRALLGAARRLLGTLHLRGRLRGVVGMEDPADAALLHGLLLALGALGVETEVECDYLEARLDLAGELRLRAWPAETLAVALELLFRRELRAALRDRA
ncbi:MAG TPA: hypothetical protein P5076_04665 [Myxococcota bacterium]|nr:hypothetical protein [Myxococcota bacterium]